MSDEIPTAFLSDRRTDIRSKRLWSQFSYVNYRLTEAVHKLILGAALPAAATVLDYGCADSPYKSLLPSGAIYIGADLPGNAGAQVELRPDGTVPLPDRSCALVLSTQVLEHVPDPDLYLRECARLLEPDGSLVLSTHGIMYYHKDPEDYWRWTFPGLTTLLERHSFVVAEARGELGLPAASLQLFQDGVAWRVPRLLRRLFVLFMQLSIRLADRKQTEARKLDNGLVLAVRAVPAVTDHL